MKLLVLPLGELTHPEAEAAVNRHFGAAHYVWWFDRAALRREPVRTLVWLRRQRFDAAVLVAANLDQPRLRLTSFLLSLPRADAWWRLDLYSHYERWNLGSHLSRNLGRILRHAAACALAYTLGHVALQVLAAYTQCSNPPGAARRLHHRLRDSLQRKKPAHASKTRSPRILYLRSQLWLGLSGGGSVAHTAGVTGGLQQLGADVMAVSSDLLPGVTAPTQVISPEVWFDSWLRELEDLAYNVPFVIGAWHAARRFGPHVIYQRHTTFNVAGALLSQALGVPLVLEYNSSEVWKGRYWDGLRLERAARLVERVNLGAADRVIVVSRVLRDELIGAGVPADRIIVNPNAVDPGLFRADLGAADVRQRLGLESSIVIGFSGTFGAWHGIPTLAAAVPLVLKARPNVRWLLVGDGPLRALLDAAAAGDDRVVRVGMLPHASMPTYLAACDVLVSPHGRQADGGEFFGSPTKLYEYMAAGRPIVASRVGQIAEVLEDGMTALLIEPDNPDALADAIVRLIDDACLRARLGRAARQAAEQRHTWRQNAKRVLAAVEHA